MAKRVRGPVHAPRLPGGGFSDATALVQERAERGEFGVEAGLLAGVGG
jgi:hypothetical protein